MVHLNLEKSGINCQVFWFLLQLLRVFDLARGGKRRCIPISWATVNAAWRPSSSITAQLRSGEHMVPTSAIPRVSHEWCPHKSCPGERKKSLKSISIQKEPPCRATCSLEKARVGYVYGITCSALEMFQRQRKGIGSSTLLWAPEAQKDDGTQLHLKRCSRIVVCPLTTAAAVSRGSAAYMQARLSGIAFTEWSFLKP